MSDLVLRSAAALRALSAAVPAIEGSIDRGVLEQAIARRYFTPAEEELLVGWLARLLTVREGLWQVIAEVSEPVAGDLSRIESDEEWRCFVLGYGAACLIVRLDRLVVEEIASHTVVQRKLNEGFAEHRIPRKSYTRIFESLTNGPNAFLLLRAMRLAKAHRARLAELAGDPHVGFVIASLETWERSLDPSKRRYLRLLFSYADHAVRRRGASARQQVEFATLESGGRVLSELRAQWVAKRIDDDVRDRLQSLLRPGDVMVTRHELAMTNLFLPGHWPHAALYIGTEADRLRLGVALDEERQQRWSGERCVLEALKDGVRFRTLAETLAVDAVAILRPRLDERVIAVALGRAAVHEGKGYNFDFDFFRSDRLVCTEVVYRAYDGLQGTRLELCERAGRPTLSAEDLLDLAFAETPFFDPVAVFGAPQAEDRLIEGAESAPVIRASYRSEL